MNLPTGVDAHDCGTLTSLPHGASCETQCAPGFVSTAGAHAGYYSWYVCMLDPAHGIGGHWVSIGYRAWGPKATNS
jgi:hypothetical protein